MSGRARALRVALLAIATLLTACPDAADHAASEATAGPEALAGQSCAVCGMVVREQPAPRAQVRHRDATSALLCSIGELRAYLEAPSPHGKPAAMWVEVLPADFSPSASSPTAHPWLDAERASYVVDVERPLVMGHPVLAFAEHDAARDAAERLGGRLVDWHLLRSTPSHLVPGPSPGKE